MPRARPVITLITDFGWQDSYVAEMKAVLLREAADACVVDVSHAIEAQDIAAGSFVLERAVLLVRIARQIVICPDNGLITWTWRRHARGKAYRLMWKPREASDTFHG